MKQLLHKWKQTAWVLLFLLTSVLGLGQVTLPHYDSIDYTVGQGLQTQAGWTSLNSGDNLAISSGSLSYVGLENSNGNKVTFDGAGIDAAKLFTQQISGTVYYSFLLNITSLGSLNSTGGYFTGFTEGTSSNFGATVWLRADGTGYDIGISPRTTAGNTSWSSGTQTINNTILVVISYQIVTGTGNDVVSLWLNPTLGQSQPTATLNLINSGGVDLSNLNRFFLRQDSLTATPFIQMDEFRIGTTWESVTPLANSAPVASSVAISGTLNIGETLTGGYDYDDADLDDEGTSTFQWYRADDASGTNSIAISGATANNYTLQAADTNKYIRFGVIPVAATGTSPGVEAFSSWVGPIIDPTAVAASITPLQALTEQNLNGNTLTLALTNTTFVDSTLDLANFTLNNAPSGVTISGVSYTNSTTAQITLAYNDTDFDANVVTFSVTIAADELASAAILTSNNLTITAVTETLSVSAINSFGSLCLNVESTQTFTVSGTNLKAGNVNLASLNGYTYSLDNTTFTTTIDIPTAGGTLNVTTVYVKLTPVAVISYDGNIVVSGVGAPSVNRSVVGSGVNTPPSITTPISASVTVNSATLGGTITALGCTNVTERGIFYSTTNGFADGAGTKVSETSGPYTTGAFTINTTGLVSNTVYYYKVFATSASGTVYTTQGTFTTAALSAPVATAATSVGETSFTANWNAVAGATGYYLDVSTYSTLSVPFASETFNNNLTLFPSTGGGSYFTGLSGTGDRPASSPFAFEGSHGLGITNGTATITSNDINTTGQNDVSLSFKLASFSIASAGNGADVGDIVTIQISPNGGVDYYSTLRVLGNNNANWGYDATGVASTNYDGNTTPIDISPAGGGNRTTDGYSTIIISNLPSTTNLRVRITLLNNSTGERWIIDDLKINTSSGALLTGFDGLLVTGTSQVVSGLTPSTDYYYRVRATDGVNITSNSNTISVRTYADISTADFRSKTSGNFNSLATWEYDTGVSTVGNAGWVDATSLPSGNNNITILASHEVTLTQNESINSGATITVNGILNASTFAIEGTGNLTIANGGVIKIANLHATNAYTAAVANTGTVSLASGSTIELNATSQQFLGTATFSNLTINNTAGVKASGDITVNGVLNLASANPNATDGALDMVIAYGTYGTVSKLDPNNFNSTLEHNNLNSYVLNLGATATVTGVGDVTGKVSRTQTFVNNTTYAFSNANMTLNFTDGGSASNLPTKITVISTRGTKGLHADKDVADNGNPAIGGAAVQRLWQILRTDGAAAARFTVRFPYKDTELNGNTEGNLVTWDHHLDAPAYAGITPHEHGKTNIDVANNFVELANHSLFYLTTEGSTTNTKYWMLSDQITTNNTWLGAANIPEGQSNWDSTSNWTSGVAPTINGHAVIEPVGVAARNPEFVSGSYSFGSIEIKTGAVVDAGAATITLNSGPATAGNVSGSWLNNGTFNAGTSTVVFNAGVDNLATLAGNTNFHNVTVNTGKTLRLEQNAVMGIAGILTVDGVLNTTQSENTVLFNGTIDQTVPATSTDNTTAAYHTLELAGAGVKSFEANPSIQGDFVKSGTSTVTIPTQFNFNGTSAQSIAGFDYNNIDFSNAGTKTFTSNGSLSNAGAITFSGTPGAVDFDGATDNLTFVLKSDASGTARIGNATDWTLSGKVTSERFVPSRRAWRLLTAPIKGTTNTSIFANWQGTNNEGILLWNPNGGGATGLEVGPQSNIFSYNGGWAAVNNTNTTPLFGATQNNAFLVFATGPHGSANITPGADPATPATATTLRPKGGLITGTVTTTLTANQFQLIGNPYASALDTEALIGSNPDAKIWMLDPTLGSFGGYVTYDGTNWAPSTPVAADKNIQSGQAFFVRSTSTLFSIGETHKVISSSNNWFERDNSASTADKIRVLLYKPEAGNWKLADGVLSVHSSVGNDAVDAADANKISNFNENIAFRNGATNLAIEYRGMPEAGTQQPLRMTGTTAQPYQLRVRTEGYVNSTLQPYLEDTVSGTLTAIPTDGSDLIVSFTGIVATTSTPDNRFRIVYPATLGLDDLSTTTVRVYPNPITDGTFSVVLHDATTPAHYSLVNVMGQEVQSGALEALHNTVAVGSLQQGIYLLQVRQEGKVFTTKLILK